jgi:NAD(P)-dependent dehydrogenase (short-subunit alcohol dehydrogenase family)
LASDTAKEATMSEPSGRSAVITGAGSGLGRDLALQLAAKGYVVFGTALAPAEALDLKQASAGRVSLTVCDITKPEAVKAWAAGVTEALGERGLDLLISNAGILTPGPLEVLPLDAIRREFEVNVFGGLSVINAFLPALRQAKGRVVQVGAMTGRFPLPFNGPSSASKAALEAFADVYRGELKPFGVDFVLAQAGNMRTGGPAKTAAALKRVADDFTDEQRRLYGKAFKLFTAALNAGQAGGLDAAASAQRIIELAEQTPAPARAPVGQDAEEILRAVHEKSDAELDAMRQHLLGLDQL